MLPDWIARQLPPGVRHRTVATGDQQMHVMEWGPAAGHTVVLAHGNPMWGFLWRKVVAALPPTLRVVVPDLVGLGLSTKPHRHSAALPAGGKPQPSSKPPGAAHTLANHARWFGALLDEVAPGPLMIAAQDWGGPISTAAMLTRRDRLRGLVLANTAVSPPATFSKPTLFHRFARAPIVSDLAFRYLGFPLRLLHTAQGDRRSIRGDVARAYRWPLPRVADREAPLALARMVPVDGDHPSVSILEQTDALFRELRVPIELVWGTRDPVLGSVVRHLQRQRPDIPVTLTEAGHFLQEEVPDQLAAAIARVAAAADWNMT